MDEERPPAAPPGPDAISGPAPFAPRPVAPSPVAAPVEGAGAPEALAGAAGIPALPSEPAATAALAWAPAPPPRRRRRGLWIALAVVVGVLVLGAGAAVTTRVLIDAHEEAMAARMVSLAQQAVIDESFARIEETTTRIGEQSSAYRDARASWDADQQEAATWRTGTTAPPAPVPNPGGAAMPGGDPTGRAFLESIGASQVQLVFNAGADNCGYEPGGGGPSLLVLGGCFDTRFPNSVMLAWEPGTEERVWAIFVHEVMHWYQYQTYYPAFLSAQRAGVDSSAYDAQLESDASCRAVAQHGIPAWQYANTSAPCNVDGWYDGWFLDHLASLGVPLTEPVAETYEVSAVVRP